MSATASTIDPLFVASIAPYVDATGFHRPTFAQCLAWYQGQFLGIYGQDVYLGNDTQDGQWLGILALAHTNCCDGLQAAYSSFSPATAQGAGLSSSVKINGLARDAATNSTCDVLVTGGVGVTIAGGSVRDTANYVWDLPAGVTIPSSGSITVTTTCETSGAVNATPGALSTINTPQLGWSTVTNLTAAAPGEAVESDAALRRRQAASTMLASQTVKDGIIGSLLALVGVSRVAVDENDTSAVDADGTQPNGSSWVVEGGDATAIATVIANKKTMGTPTGGTTSETITDSAGLSQTINFYRPTETTIAFALVLKALPGYTFAIGAAAAASVAASIAALPIGGTIYLNRLFGPATSAMGASTFVVTAITLARSGGTLTAADIVLAFNEAAVCTAANGTVTAS